MQTHVAKQSPNPVYNKKLYFEINHSERKILDRDGEENQRLCMRCVLRSVPERREEGVSQKEVKSKIKSPMNKN